MLFTWKLERYSCVCILYLSHSLSEIRLNYFENTRYERARVHWCISRNINFTFAPSLAITIMIASPVEHVLNMNSGIIKNLHSFGIIQGNSFVTLIRSSLARIHIAPPEKKRAIWINYINMQRYKNFKGFNGTEKQIRVSTSISSLCAYQYFCSLSTLMCMPRASWKRAPAECQQPVNIVT